MNAKLSQEEVRAIVRELCSTRQEPGESGLDYANRINAVVARIEAGGWKLGLSLGSVWQTKARRGDHYLLKKPRLKYLVVAAFYDADSPMSYVHYYNNEMDTKGQAMLLVKSLPAPGAMPLTQTDLFCPDAGSPSCVGSRDCSQV